MIRLNAGTERHRAQSRRQHRAAAIHAGHDERPRAPLRPRPGARGRHAESRVHACGNPASTGSRVDADGNATDSSCARARARCMAKARRTSSTRGNRIASRERACASTSRSPRRASTISIAGRSIATAATTPRSPPAMYRRTSSAIRTSMRTARGAPTRPTATSGSRIASPPAGRRTATAIGHGSTPGVGRGSMTRRGASPSPTTVAGRTCAARWGWVPGPVRTRAYYAPALVAFVGGNNFQLSISSGNVGGVAWFPLGPREVYRPSYPVSRGYFEKVNRQQHGRQHHRHQQLLQQHERDQRHLRQPAGAGRRRRRADDRVRAVAAGGAVGGSRDAARWWPAHRSPLSPPSRRPRRSVRGAAAQGDKPPARVFERPVVARTAPAPAQASFAAQQQQLQTRQGKPLDDAARKQIQAAPAAPAPAVKVVAQPKAAPPTAQPAGGTHWPGHSHSRHSGAGECWCAGCAGPGRRARNGARASRAAWCGTATSGSDASAARANSADASPTRRATQAATPPPAAPPQTHVATPAPRAPPAQPQVAAPAAGAGASRRKRRPAWQGTTARQG